MTIMARTKKQTLENASERKRQIQEEILRETLAAKQKKENLFSSTVKGNDVAVVPDGAATSPKNKIASAGACCFSMMSDVNPGLVDSMSVRAPSPKDVSCTSAKDISSMTKSELLKAVIYIPDICRSPTKSHDDDSCWQNSKETAQRRKSFSTTIESCSSDRQGSSKKRYDSQRLLVKKSLSSPISLSKSVQTVNENIGEEKSRKFRQGLLSHTVQLRDKCVGVSTIERRSPRQHSPKVSPDYHSGERKNRDSQYCIDEKPKVNIFTDNLGKDLGKRIRSPRRLSEDMIALPIFSARRWSNSAKESSPNTFVTEKMIEHSLSSGSMESPSSSTNLNNNECFKSPNISQSPSKRSLSYGSPPKTPPSPGSKNTSVLVLHQTTLLSLDGKSQNTSSSLHSDHGRLKESSHVDSLVESKSKPHQDAHILSQDKPSKSYPLRNTKSIMSEEMECSYDPKSVRKTSRKFDLEEMSRSNLDDVTNATQIFHDYGSSLYCVKKVVKASAKLKREKSQIQIKDEVEEQMSSICRELMSDLIIPKNSEVSMINEDHTKSKVKTEICEISGASSYLGSYEKDIKTSVETSAKEDSNLEQKDTNSDIANLPSENLWRNVSDEVEDEKPQSSLLCAMLVGGTEVADSYSQERQRYKPQVVEISDSEPDTSRPITPAGLLTEASTLQVCSQSVSSVIQCKCTYPTVPLKNSSDASESTESLQIMKRVTSCHSQKLGEDETKKAMNHISKEDSKVKEETKKCEVLKNCKIDFSGKLKQLNEKVLKLLEIDVEEEFLQDLEVDDMHVSPLSGASDSSLYDLITNLGDRLRKADNLIPNSTPVDVEVVEKLIRSCPVRTPKVISKLKTELRMSKICHRLEEKNKEEKHTTHGLWVTENPMNEPLASTEKTPLNTYADITEAKHEFINSDTHEKPYKLSSLSKQAVEKNKLKPSDSVSSNNIAMFNGPLTVTTSSSNVIDSPCDMDVEPVASAITKCVNQESNVDHDEFKYHNSALDSRKTEMSTKRSFHKSKTCDDFNECPSLSPINYSGSLRRVNSSPHINAKLTHSALSSPISLSNKETQVKSKLGSKIPVPGTSYIMKSSKKTWRTPRVIVEPKPLVILSELEELSSCNKYIFICPNLQKYLSIPSNRIIVPPDKKEEMKILDAKAKEEEEMRELQMKEKEDKERKSEEKVDLEYRKFEPDFDEVDGMLFMSFSNEVELRAHVRVEKALDWDKDDTMLRISRAKAFEEAKAHNEDMGEFKLKQLRGQHMRWKKYRRLYSSEVKALLEAQEKGIPLASVPKKTSDVSKIKGWKRKQTQVQETSIQANVTTISDTSLEQDTMDLTMTNVKGEVSCGDESFGGDDNGKSDLLPNSRRRQGFSHQKAHKQLFRELKMDWEDRMIHRKLGGWSLKGNRPRAFSRAALKRQEKESREVLSFSADFTDFNLESTVEEIENDGLESKGLSEGLKRKKLMKIIYPLLTEKMARNALKTLETGDVRRGLKRSKKLQQDCTLPPLTPIKNGSSPPKAPLTPLSGAATAGSSTVTILSTPPLPTALPSTSSSVSTVSTPLALDFQNEPVLEGVDTAAESISSPSIADTASSKSCSKLGCRYGCICHLCSVGETSAPLPSPVAKLPAPACDKEYCRLGCICDSIDPEKISSNHSHCGKPSCMLHCICSEVGSTYGNDDIPYLPSMRRRPKPGERFSNLPQRERTHRSAKNLDAITRKAMMLYETSEIYCEKVERTKKKPETSSTSVGNLSLVTQGSAGPLVIVDVDDAPEPSADEDSIQTDTLFNAVNLTTSEATTVAAMNLTTSDVTTVTSHHINSNNSGSQHCHYIKSSTPTAAKLAFIVEDQRQTVPVIEPSVHKRKRKSHPLSDEIFTASTCARIIPYKSRNSSTDSLLPTADEIQREDIILVPQTDLKSQKSNSDMVKSSNCDTSVKTKSLTEFNKQEQSLSKVCSVETSPGASKTSTETLQWENNEPEVIIEPPENINSVTTTSVSATLKCPKNLSGQSKSVSHGCNESGHARQHYGWHTSMVCLKARATTSNHSPGEEDIQEEDEVKLLEFAANCNWEGAKKEILARVAQCLTRGQYPQPRTMNVCEFVVEILPKAHQPSLIPPELRVKLPGQMYSIRVRITRREAVSNVEKESDVIDLSEPSPVKIGKCTAKDSDLSKSVVQNSDNDSKSTEQSLSLAASPSDSTWMTSSFGISGLSNLCIKGSSLSGPSKQNTSVSSQTTKARASRTLIASNRQKSVESAGSDKVELEQFTSSSPAAVTSSVTKHKGSSLKTSRSGSVTKHKGSSLKTARSGSVTKETNDNTVDSNDVITSTATTSSFKLNNLPKESVKSNLSSNQVNPTQTLHQITPVIGPFTSKDLKYMKISKDGMMKLFEVAAPADKKVIALPLALSKVPVDFKGKQGSVPVVALPVGGTVPSRVVPILTTQAISSQLKNVPTSNAPPQIVLKLPSASVTGAQGALMTVGKQSKVIQPVQGSNKSQTTYQFVPLSKNSFAAFKDNSTAANSKDTVPKVRALNSSEEMIMVFDASHIKASQLCKSNSTTQKHVSKADSDDCKVSMGEMNANQNPVYVNASKSQSAEMCSSKLNSALNRAMDLTPDDKAFMVTLPNAQDVPENSGAAEECDTTFNASAAHNTHTSCETASSVKFNLKSSDHSTTVLKNDSNSCKNSSLNNAIHSTMTNNACENKVSSTLSSTASNTNPNVSVSTCSDTDVGVYGMHHDKSPASLEPSTIANEKIPRTQYELVQIGSKRGLGHMLETVECETLSTFPKRPCLSAEALSINDEDSNVSVNIGSDIRTVVASPQDSVDGPKSVLSTAMSSGSSDDLLILLSSDDEVDVGGDDNTGEVITKREMAERALENDHGSMYIKTDLVVNPVNTKGIELTVGSLKKWPKLLSDEETKPVQGEQQRLRNLRAAMENRTAHHNTLERLRRSKLKQLFDDLQDQVMHGKNQPKDGKRNVMSKVKVLSEAKKLILSLRVAVRQGDLQVEQYERQNRLLHSKLTRLKARSLEKKIPAETIKLIQERVSNNCEMQNIETVPSLNEVHIKESSSLIDNKLAVSTDFDDSMETVDLVSPSTIDDKASDRPDVSTPVYEDISDLEESSAYKYDDDSDLDEMESKYENSDSEEAQKKKPI